MIDVYINNSNQNKLMAELHKQSEMARRLFAGKSFQEAHAEVYNSKTKAGMASKMLTNAFKTGKTSGNYGTHEEHAEMESKYRAERAKRNKV